MSERRMPMVAIAAVVAEPMGRKGETLIVLAPTHHRHRRKTSGLWSVEESTNGVGCLRVVTERKCTQLGYVGGPPGNGANAPIDKINSPVAR